MLSLWDVDVPAPNAPPGSEVCIFLPHTESLSALVAVTLKCTRLAAASLLGFSYPALHAHSRAERTWSQAGLRAKRVLGLQMVRRTIAPFLAGRRVMGSSTRVGTVREERMSRDRPKKLIAVSTRAGARTTQTSSRLWRRHACTSSAARSPRSPSHRAPVCPCAFPRGREGGREAHVRVTAPSPLPSHCFLTRHRHILSE